MSKNAHDAFMKSYYDVNKNKIQGRANAIKKLQEQKPEEKEETFLKWCYVGDKKDTVVMVMDSETFECLRQTLEEHKKLKKYVDRYESDMVNGFPTPDWRRMND